MLSEKKTEKPVGGAPATETQPKRILVVEDDLLARLALEYALGRASFELVAAVASAEEAIAAVERHRPDLVLMDVNISGSRDGVDVALELWQRFQIPCLFVSANLDDETRRRAKPAHPWGFLAKPFSYERLVVAITNKGNQT